MTLFDYVLLPCKFWCNFCQNQGRDVDQTKSQKCLVKLIVWFNCIRRGQKRKNSWAIRSLGWFFLSLLTLINEKAYGSLVFSMANTLSASLKLHPSHSFTSNIRQIAPEQCVFLKAINGQGKLLFSVGLDSFSSVLTLGQSISWGISRYPEQFWMPGDPYTGKRSMDSLSLGGVVLQLHV